MKITAKLTLALIAIGLCTISIFRSDFHVNFVHERLNLDHNHPQINGFRGVPGPELFLANVNVTGRINGYISDKFLGTVQGGHSYFTMYGLFLDPYIQFAKKNNVTVKLFEIGLGCDMHYGVGLSAHAWRRLYPDIEVWFAESNITCLNTATVQRHLHELNIRAVGGNQANPRVLAQWINTTGGNFDIIIDDGGHQNKQIYSCFKGLWRALRPGGLYFIEDLQVGRNGTSFNSDLGKEHPVMTDVIQSWIDQITVPAEATHGSYVHNRKHYPLPPRVKWIMCQYESCVVAKCHEADPARCSQERPTEKRIDNVRSARSSSRPDVQ